MAHKILMPALSPTMKSGKIAKWKVVEGEKIEIGQVIAEIETDKAVMEFESTDCGFLGKVLHFEGEEVATGTHIAWLLENKDEQISNTTSTIIEEWYSKEENISLENKTNLSDAKIDKEVLFEKGRKNARSTPAARARALELGISIEDISLGRRIRERDILEMSRNPVLEKIIENDQRTNTNLIKLSTMQKVIAQRMSSSKQQVPHFYIETDVNIDELIKLKESLSITLKTTLTHWIVLAAAHAIEQTPVILNSWNNGHLIKADSIDISIAVDVPNGLLTPVVRKVNKLKITELVKTINNLVEKARNKGLQPNEYEGGVITISNMGAWGITRLYPIINQPQSGTMGIGCSRECISLAGGQVKAKKIISATFSGDHRILNGSDGAAFLKAFKMAIENPSTLLI
jgi:pyruvate dehydrogenase E2 component (dihydrolipoamide acetyltransferase)